MPKKVDDVMKFSAFGGAAIAMSGVGAAQADEDIGGFYGGLTFGNTISSSEFAGNGSEYFLDGTSLGGFVGYNFVNGDWIYGGELTYTNSIDATDDGFSFYSNNGLEGVLGIKARLGRTFGGGSSSFGSWFVYGTVGFVDADARTPGNTTSSADGMTFGIGAETMLSDRMFMGVEVQRNNLDLAPSVPDNYVSNSNLDFTSVSLRVGFNF